MNQTYFQHARQSLLVEMSRTVLAKKKCCAKLQVELIYFSCNPLSNPEKSTNFLLSFNKWQKISPPTYLDDRENTSYIQVDRIIPICSIYVHIQFLVRL